MAYLISLVLVLPCVRASAYQSAADHEGRASSHRNAGPLRFASVYPSAASPLGLASVYPSAASHIGLASVPASHLGFGRLVQLRGNAHRVYASDPSGEEYEPYAVAALPLRPPAVLQVLSPSAYKPGRPAKRPRPEPADWYAVEPAYESAEYEHAYASSEPSQPKHSEARDQYEDAESSVVLYARPNRHGGFSYRRPAAPARAPEPREPVIIRIHKYKVIH